MHSYDNGNAAKAKKDNWVQLLKVFRKLGFPDLCTEQESHWISSLEEGSAVLFLCRVYELLTQRKLSMQVKPPTKNKVAGYAKDTGVTKVRRAMDVNGLEEGKDHQQTLRLLSKVVEGHEAKLQEERFTEPERYSVTSSVLKGKTGGGGGGGSSVRGGHDGASTLGGDASVASRRSNTAYRETLPQIKAKEIQVRQLDRSVASLRLSKEQGGRPGSPPRSPQSPGQQVGSGVAPLSPGARSLSSRNTHNNNNFEDPRYASQFTDKPGDGSSFVACWAAAARELSVAAERLHWPSDEPE